MDIVTHALLGAVTAQSVCRPQHLRLAGAVGAIAALLPDLDVLIRSGDDALTTLIYHRHFTHSLFFAPLGALLASLLLWPIVRRHLNKAQVYIYALTGYLSACLLDVCTSYGTHLFWPLINTPVSLSIIAVVDPLFSLLLIIAITAATYGRRKVWCGIGLGCAVLYLSLGAIQHQRAFAAAEALAEQHGVTPSRIIIKPTLANLILWRALIVDGDSIQAAAVRVGLNPEPITYLGESAMLIDPIRWQQLPHSSRAYDDLHRFHALTEGMLGIHPQHEHFVGDLRYAMIPTSLAPIWGIEIDPEHPDLPAVFKVDRTMTSAMKEQLFAMLKGRTVQEAAYK